MFPTWEITRQEEESRLVVRCRAGDRDALEQVFAQYERLIFRYAYRMLGHREDALDMQQETFLRAFQGMPHFRGEASLQTWLLRICANACRQQLRTRRTQHHWQQEELDAEIADAERTDPYHIVTHSEERTILHIALRSLPPRERELILLHEYEDLSHAEIGMILRCAPVTVRVRLFRARRRLQERMTSLLKARR